LDSGTAGFTEFADNPSTCTNHDDLIALGETYREGIDFTFSTTFQWGELSAGDWTLEIQDTVAGTSGTLNSWGLTVYGDVPSEDDTYFYSDSFGDIVNRDSNTNRTLLTDTAGTDRINAAMVTQGILLNLLPGSTSEIAGQALTLDSSTLIEQAVGGDGTDRIQGNAVDNRLEGGRDNDRLFGQDGADNLFGESGNDRLKGGNDNDRLLGQSGRDRLLGGNGDDRLIGGGEYDRLLGGDGSDVLRGGRGDDQLFGQGGDIDRMFGNQGNDMFMIERGDGYSLIQDFQNGRDRVGLGAGISFGRLKLVQDGRDVELRFRSDVIAIMQNTQVNQLSRADFT
ncbi:MAG: proprotein convertase P-domain-containing protein, partial [Leptolyngbyaceae cyanobacterium]